MMVPRRVIPSFVARLGERDAGDSEAALSPVPPLRFLDLPRVRPRLSRRACPFSAAAPSGVLAGSSLSSDVGVGGSSLPASSSPPASLSLRGGAERVFPTSLRPPLEPFENLRDIESPRGHLRPLSTLLPLCSSPFFQNIWVWTSGTRMDAFNAKKGSQFPDFASYRSSAHAEQSCITALGGGGHMFDA